MRRSTSGLGLAAVLAVGVVVAACGSPETSTGPLASPTTATAPTRQEPPTRPADLVGTITVLTPFEPITENCTPLEKLAPDDVVSSDDPPICSDPAVDIAGTILVEASPNATLSGLGDRASLTVRTGETTIWLCESPGQAVEGSFDDLATGAAVSAWVDGPIAESYPVQATATVLAVGSGCS
jgi:hypothetical protein